MGHCAGSGFSEQRRQASQRHGCYDSCCRNHHVFGDKRPAEKHGRQLHRQQQSRRDHRREYYPRDCDSRCAASRPIEFQSLDPEQRKGRIGQQIEQRTSHGQQVGHIGLCDIRDTEDEDSDHGKRRRPGRKKGSKNNAASIPIMSMKKSRTSQLRPATKLCSSSSATPYPATNKTMHQTPSLRQRTFLSPMTASQSRKVKTR
jgi:hypothetical protein